VRRICLYILLLLIHLSIHGQDWNTARLSLLYGSNIPFNFNSIQRYVDGIEIEDGTILGISMKSGNQPGHELDGFDIQIRSFNGAATIKGDVHDLNLQSIRLKVENHIGLGAGVSLGYQELSSTWTSMFTYYADLFTDLTWDQHQISVSYECGKPVSEGGTGSLLGEEPDYYSVEIEIEIIPNGIGF
jgi:hypothetical protein